jgi:hypothetical protein
MICNDLHQIEAASGGINGLAKRLHVSSLKVIKKQTA